ncbi:Uncharacterised protein [Slackia heliotrinireducens]|nr:Uncharacterised protein [Slackia heliotrinireducens]
MKEKAKYVPRSVEQKYDYSTFRLWGGLIGAAILLCLGFWGYDWSGPSNFFTGIAGIIFLPIMGAVPGIIIGAIVCAVLKASAKEKYDAKRNA